MNSPAVLILGAGYTAGYTACSVRCRCSDITISGTSRTPARFEQLRGNGIEPLLFDGHTVSAELRRAVREATHILISIAPGEHATDPVQQAFGRDELRTLLTHANAPPRWIGYLSTVGVYGDAGGAWVDEDSVCNPASKRSRWRLLAEQQWRELAEECGARLGVFRLPGIYGPGRNALLKLHSGQARRLVKPGQVFNRAHVEDIARALSGALLSGASGIYNICDNLPAAPQDVVSYAADLMGVEPPPEIDFASADLTPMARTFYGENKRVSNARSLTIEGMRYRYPDYKAGLTALWTSGRWSGS